MALSPVEVSNRAFALLGAIPIQSLEEETDLARLAKGTYSGIRNAALGSHPWRWAVHRQQLNRSTAKPVNEYQYSYPLPGDLLGSGPRSVYRAASGVPPDPEGWVIVGRSIETNLPAVWVEYIRDVDEQQWPPLFSEYVVAALAAQWAYAVTDQANLAQHYQNLSMERAAMAKGEEGQTSPAVQMTDFPVFDARYRD